MRVSITDHKLSEHTHNIVNCYEVTTKEGYKFKMDYCAHISDVQDEKDVRVKAYNTLSYMGIKGASLEFVSTEWTDDF